MGRGRHAIYCEYHSEPKNRLQDIKNEYCKTRKLPQVKVGERTHMRRKTVIVQSFTTKNGTRYNTSRGVPDDIFRDVLNNKISKEDGFNILDQMNIHILRK